MMRIRSNLEAPRQIDQSYEDRVVAFIDIMGFTNLIEDSTSPMPVKGILRLLDEFESISANLADPLGNAKRKIKGGYATFFSDSVVISYPNHHENYIPLLALVSSLCINLCPSGIFLRGGVTTGNLFHRNGRIFGPGLVAAYKMESRLAFYPRVIVSDKIVEAIPKKDGELRRDFDGLHFVDWLPYMISAGDPDLRIEHQNFSDALFKPQIDRFRGNQPVLQKIMWLSGYLDRVVEELESR